MRRFSRDCPGFSGPGLCAMARWNVPHARDNIPRGAFATGVHDSRREGSGQPGPEPPNWDARQERRALMRRKWRSPSQAAVCLDAVAGLGCECMEPHMRPMLETATRRDTIDSTSARQRVQVVKTTQYQRFKNMASRSSKKRPARPDSVVIKKTHSQPWHPLRFSRTSGA